MDQTKCLTPPGVANNNTSSLFSHGVVVEVNDHRPVHHAPATEADGANLVFWLHHRPALYRSGGLLAATAGSEPAAAR